MESISKLKIGTKAKIVKIDAGKELTGQIKHMGLFKGEEIKVVQNTKGPILIAKGSLRLALGRGMAQKVFVEIL
jgi:ferrous iron transport protein A